jgi:hypothetical protein
MCLSRTAIVLGGLAVRVWLVVVHGLCCLSDRFATSPSMSCMIVDDTCRLRLCGYLPIKLTVTAVVGEEVPALILARSPLIYRRC